MGHPLLNAEHIQLVDAHGGSEYCRQNGKTDPVSQTEHPGRALHQTAEQEQEFHAVRSAQTQKFGSSKFRRHGDKQRAEDLKQRYQLPAAHRIAGAFQIPAAVQQQRNDGKHDAHQCQHPQAVQIGDFVDAPGIGEQPSHFVKIGASVFDIHADIHHAVRRHQLGSQRIGGDDAVEHGGIDGIHQPVEDAGAEVHKTVGSHHGEPGADDHGTKHRDAEQADKIHIGNNKIPHRNLPRTRENGPQQEGQQNQGIDGGGNEGVRKTGQPVGHKPGFPPQGQGVEGVAHPGVIQVAEEKLRHQAGIAYVQNGEPAKQTADLIEKVIFRVTISRLLPAHQGQQHQKQGVQRQDRGKPGEIFCKRGTIKAEFP